LLIFPLISPAFLKTTAVSGYLHPSYAKSLAEFGTPLELPRSKGWILEREIPGSPYRDAMGCYPLFVCQDWSQIYADLEDIGDELVTLSVVTDPFGQYETTYLRRCFRDVVLPLKEHFIVDLRRPMDTFVCKHHRRYARNACQRLYIEKCEDPTKFVEEWAQLYSGLIKRHNIKGMLAFSRLTFVKQLKVPGIVVFRAVHEEETLGMLLHIAPSAMT
jgi:hypothetical protein